MDSLERAYMVVRALASKKAQDLVILDLRGLTLIADYFVISTGPSGPNIWAQVDAVLDAAHEVGIKGVRPEGIETTSWVLMDLGDVIAHIFEPEMRDFYQLERLWADAPRVPLPEDAL